METKFPAAGLQRAYLQPGPDERVQLTNLQTLPIQPAEPRLVKASHFGSKLGMGTASAQRLCTTILVLHTLVASVTDLAT
jgi:hypothetical protein